MGEGFSYNPGDDKRRTLGAENEEQKKLADLRARLEAMPLGNMDRANILKVAMEIYGNEDMETIKRNLVDVGLMMSSLLPNKAEKLEQILEEN